MMRQYNTPRRNRRNALRDYMQRITVGHVPVIHHIAKAHKVAILKLKPQGITRLKASGLVGELDTDLAEAIDVDRTTVYRVTTGQTAPGMRFVAGVVNAFGPEWFSQIFEAVDDRRPSRKPAKRGVVR